MKGIQYFFALWLLSTLILGLPPSDDRPDSGSLLKLDVAVTDKNGNPIVGLDKSNFRLFENDVEHTITAVSHDRQPAAVVIIAESSDTFVNYNDNIMEPAARFIESLPVNSWIALVTFNMQPAIVVDFTRDSAELFRGVQEMQMPFSKEASLYDALHLVLERMGEVEGRRAILLLASGVDTISRHNYVETLKLAEASDTKIYAVGLTQFTRSVLQSYGGAEPRLDEMMAENVMRSLSRESGGVSFFPRFAGEYRDIYATVNADLKNQYTLEYASTASKSDGRFRKLKVEVIHVDINRDGKPDKLTVRHKIGYRPE
jgi:VWFA-related protein